MSVALSSRVVAAPDPLSRLVLACLDAQDGVALVLTPPEPGQPATIAEASASLARLIGRPLPPGTRLTALTDESTTPEWRRLLEAIASGHDLRGELPCRTAAGDRLWLGVALAHVADRADEAIHPVLTGHDVGAERRHREEEVSTRTLLGSIFMMTDAAVVLVRADGRISMANPAMTALVGHDAAALTGKPVRELTHPDDVAAAAANHARQLEGGGTYRMALRTVHRDGRVIPVQLTSVLVERSRLERFRVVTLKPDSAHPPEESEATAVAAVGRVQTISLAALREVLGDEWEAASARLVLLAEAIVKRRLGPRDVFARAPEGFAIWFADGDPPAVAARVAAIVREIRIRLLGELGEGHAAIAGQVTGIAGQVRLEAPPGPPTVARLAPLETLLAQQQDAIRAQARAVVAALAADPPMEVARIIDREDRAVPLSWADLPRADRLRLHSALASLPEDAPEAHAADAELLRLRLTLAGLARDVAEARPGAWLLPISCAALLVGARRDRLLGALRAIPAPLRGRLRGLLADIPPGTAEGRLHQWLTLLGPLLHDIGVVAVAPELPQAANLRPPCRLVAIDVEAGTPPSEEAAFELMGTARRLGLPVLVRTARSAEARDWRELGATLFAITAAS